MDKKLLFNLAYWILIVVVIGTCFYVVFYLRSNGKQCLADPLEFYAKKMGTQCFCMDKFFMP